MIVYVPVGNGPVRREYVAAGAGMIVQANKFRFPKLDCPWIMDNGVFEAWKDGVPWEEKKFLKSVDKVMGVQPCERPEWCLTPDLVASPKSLGHSVAWRKRLPNGLRWYFAVQDGMSPEMVENALASAHFVGLFIGGSLEWKNTTSAMWCAFGRAKKLPVHLGRVNGGRRLQWAYNIGATSLDGTGWTREKDWPHWVRSIRDPEGPDKLLFDDVVEDVQSNSRAAARRKTNAG